MRSQTFSVRCDDEDTVVAALREWYRDRDFDALAEPRWRNPTTDEMTELPAFPHLSIPSVARFCEALDLPLWATDAHERKWTRVDLP